MAFLSPCLQGPKDPKPTYIFELTTPAFAVSNEGILVVNQKNLDRDKEPATLATYRFQVRFL